MPARPGHLNSRDRPCIWTHYQRESLLNFKISSKQVYSTYIIRLWRSWETFPSNTSLWSLMISCGKMGATKFIVYRGRTSLELTDLPIFLGRTVDWTVNGSFPCTVSMTGATFWTCAWCRIGMTVHAGTFAVSIFDLMTFA